MIIHVAVEDDMTPDEWDTPAEAANAECEHLRTDRDSTRCPDCDAELVYGDEVLMALDMDYIDVAARIVEFRTKHPEGSLQPADPAVPFRVVELAGQPYIVVVAAAYRTPDDPRPGIGMAYEPVPGKTNFTRGSELQNAETSAWGRAIVAAMAGDTKRSVASAEEVRNRQADREWEANPTWDAIEQATLAAGYIAEIEDAKTDDEISAVGKRVHAQRRKKELSPGSVDLITRAAAARKAELNGGESHAGAGKPEAVPA